MAQDPSDTADQSLPRSPEDSSDLISFTLESLAGAVNYHRWLCDLVQPHLGEDPLEIGSGLGDYAATWLERGIPRITISDNDPARHAVLTRRFAGMPGAIVRDLDVFQPGEASYSALVAINVLEHISDDVGALKAAHRLVRSGGKVVMFVPAFPFVMSEFDRQAGHYRRYRKATLGAAFGQAGLRLQQMHYVNAPGLLAWFVGMRLLRMTPQDSALVRVWDRVVVPTARAIETRVRPPFGQSVLAIGVVD